MPTLAEILAAKKQPAFSHTVTSCPVEVFLALYTSIARNSYLLEDYEAFLTLHTWLQPFSYGKYKDAKGIKFLDNADVRGLSNITGIPVEVLQEAIFEIEAFRIQERKQHGT